MKIQKKQKGFTLIELMIVIAIVGILAAVAVPMYSNYTLKANMSNLVGMTDAYKSAVGLCINETGTETGCNHGANGIPGALGASGHLTSLQVANGTITVVSDLTTTGASPVTNATFVLNPSVNNGVITWAQEGTCDDDLEQPLC